MYSMKNLLLNMSCEPYRFSPTADPIAAHGTPSARAAGVVDAVGAAGVLAGLVARRAPGHCCRC